MRALRLPLFLILSLLVSNCRNGAAASPPAGEPPPVAQTSPQAAAPAGDIPPAEVLLGTVEETFDGGAYTYVRMKTTRGEVWIAAPAFGTKVGDRLKVSVDMPMRDFHSKTLNRDFPLLYFGFAIERDGTPLTPTGHGSATSLDQNAPVTPVAPPAGGLAIADVWSKRNTLAGKTVVVRGTVVKVNNNIMERNWVHLRDGSGSADAGTHDLTMTTAATLKPGEVVTASGVIAVDKTFGAGYSYDVILENATVTAK